MHFIEKLNSCENLGKIPSEIAYTIRTFFSSYALAISNNCGRVEDQFPLLNKLLDLVIDQIQNPYCFPPYHQKIVAPFDYYQFGLDFIRPIVRLEQSRIIGENKIAEIENYIDRGHNVILFSNHQTEPDPQAISLLLEKSHGSFAKNLILIAGHRVTTDPLAVPFSKGRDLLCIFSKNYLEHPPEKKREKVQHNQKTMRIMQELLSEGGKAIYVAPSGGRDRPNQEGIVEVAPFDAQSIEMFWLTASHSVKPTHFYPLALSTFNLLPPPTGVKQELGENRETQSTPIHVAFGAEIDMNHFPGSDVEDKKQRRAERAEHIWKKVKSLYDKISHAAT